MFRDTTVAGSWELLCQRVDATGALPRWAGAEPALAGLTRLADLPDAVAADPGRADALIGALLRLASVRGGDDLDALLALLHLLSPGVVQAAQGIADLAPDPIGLLVGQLTVLIRGHGPGPRHGLRERAFAANLLRDARHAVLAELCPQPARGARRRGREWLVDPTDACAVTLLDTVVPGPDADRPGERELAELIERATGAGLVSARDLAVLVEAERSRSRKACAERQPSVAARLGIHPITLRRRRNRAVAALRLAAAAHRHTAA